MSAIPVITIVGRPNVGKSTLFNYLTRSRDALVANEPGVTRDRQYGRARIGERACLVVDTGGLTDERDGIDPFVVQQAEQALQEADLVLFMVDARAGLNTADHVIAQRLRRIDKPIRLLVNKTDGLDADVVSADFYSLGFAEMQAISAAHGRGIHQLRDDIENLLGPAPEDQEEGVDEGPRVALVGRPNVGKSTLVNRLVGEERVVAFDRPGTTRDSIFVPFSRDGRPYTLIDTAGVRRRSRVDEGLEKFSVIKTLQAIEICQVVVLLVDARDGVTDQDAHLLGHIQRSGRALVIAVNKWDGLQDDERERIRSELERRFTFINFADIHFISALHGTNVGHLYESIDTAFASAGANLSTSRLTRILEDAVQAHPPPSVRGRRIKLRYAHQGGSTPPRIIIHGNQTESLSDQYKRYLSSSFRKALGLRGTPILIELRTGDNPFKGRKNKLTPRQQKSRQRLMKHVGKKK